MTVVLSGCIVSKLSHLAVLVEMLSLGTCSIVVATICEAGGADAGFVLQG
jgi:hypothetical protein